MLHLAVDEARLPILVAGLVSAVGEQQRAYVSVADLDLWIHNFTCTSRCEGTRLLLGVTLGWR